MGRLRDVVVLCVSVLLAAPAPAGASPASQWRAATESAPGRVVLPLGQVQLGQAVLPLAGGNIVVAGVSSSGSPQSGKLESAELLPDGRLDPTYGEGGVSLTPIALQPWSIFALPDGRLLVAGPNHNPLQAASAKLPDWQLVRLLPNGKPDPGFGHDGLVDVGRTQALLPSPAGELAPELAPNGDIVLPTLIGGPLPQALPGLVRLNPDGSPDSTFGTNGVLQLPGEKGMFVGSFSVRPDGSIVVVETADGSARSLLLRLTAAGSPDPSFAGGSPVTLSSHVGNMLVGADGGIVLFTYNTSTVYDSMLVRYTVAGTLDPTWGTGGATDLGPGHNLNRLFPAPGGEILLVSLAVPAPMRPVLGPAFHEQIVRLTAKGQIDPTLGGPEGLLVSLPFGGGTYPPGAIANLTQNGFGPAGVTQRADGTLLFYGSVEASEARGTEGGGEEVFAAAGGFALAALNSSFTLDRSFGGPGSLRLSAHVLSTRLTARGIAVRLHSSGAGLCVVSVRAGGMTIARATVPFLAKPPSRQATTALTARIPLTRAGRRLLRRHRRLHIAVSAAATDLAANHVTARTSAVLAG